MAELKTKENDASVSDFLATVDDERKRQDCDELIAIMTAVTGHEPKMWGNSIVGFGRYHYTYTSGREGDWMVTGFSLRKQNLTIYIMNGFSAYDALMQQLGTYKTGKSCLYVKRLDAIDRACLTTLITQSVADMTRLYECR